MSTQVRINQRVGLKDKMSTRAIGNAAAKLNLQMADDYTNNKISRPLQGEKTYIFIRRFLRHRVIPRRGFTPPRLVCLT
jgi:carbamoylphosphate synthase large subunit